MIFAETNARVPVNTAELQHEHQHEDIKEAQRVNAHPLRQLPQLNLVLTATPPLLGVPTLAGYRALVLNRQ